MKRLNFLALLIVSLFIANVNANEDMDNPRFKAVKNYLIEGGDYPEVFNNEKLEMRLRGLAIGDLDSDGEDEVVLQFEPHYLQSPTIIIFQVDNQMNVTRVIEGLAPGKLKKISGDYLDSHNMLDSQKESLGIDLTLGATPSSKQAKNKLVQEALNSFGGIVYYSDWLHVDKRSGKGMYIDMSDAKLPTNEKTCEHFEFSTVENILIASFEGEKGLSLLVSVNGSIYKYKIHKFLKSGLMDKEFKMLSK